MFRKAYQIVWAWARKRPKIESRKLNFEVRTAEKAWAVRVSSCEINLRLTDFYGGESYVKFADGDSLYGV